ncbi:hypothetical protein [Fortiea contorta]|uniref:hypothetical protein n=1 Tax=Fortiea contorta TaxID=1892405 RepID=UPI0003465DC9|nr:hypothetical protein [Fortiea contorta]
MLAQFQSLYPNGSIISELVQIFQGKYIVRVSVQIEGITRATGMSAAETVEVAEDQARSRALMVLGISNTSKESVTFSAKLVSQVQGNSSLSTGSVLNEPVSFPTPHPDLVSGQWSGVSHKEAIAPSTTPQTIKSEPEISTAPTSENDIYTQDFRQQFSLHSPPEVEFDTPVESREFHSSQEPETKPSPGITASNVTPFTPRSHSSSEEMETLAATKKKKKNAPVDLSDVIAKTDVELQRLGWTPEQGRDHLIKTYGKRGRTLLTEEELHGFLKYLESQPTSIDPLTGF